MSKYAISLTQLMHHVIGNIIITSKHHPYIISYYCLVCYLEFTGSCSRNRNPNPYCRCCEKKNPPITKKPAGWQPLALSLTFLVSWLKRHICVTPWFGVSKNFHWPDFQNLKFFNTEYIWFNRKQNPLAWLTVLLAPSGSGVLGALDVIWFMQH